MAIRTDHIPGEDRQASEINEENQAILDGQGIIVSGKGFSNPNTSTPERFPLYTSNPSEYIYGNAAGFFHIDAKDGILDVHNGTTEYPLANDIAGVFIDYENDYIYMYYVDSSPRAYQLWRYDRADFGNPIQMTGYTFGSDTSDFSFMACDGTDLYFTHNGGNGLSFGDGTTQYDVTEPVSGTWRYTYDGTGTAPLFVTNGLAIGAIINVSGGFVANNTGDRTVTAVTETYFECQPSQGAEILTNGSFDGSSPWSFSTGWSYDGTNFEADFTGSGGGSLVYQNPTVSNNAYYDISFTLSNYSGTSGYFAPYIRGTEGTQRQANGTYVEQVQDGASGSFVGAIANPNSTATVGTVDDISVKLSKGFVESNVTGVTISSAAIVKLTISGTTLTSPTVISLGTTAGKVDKIGVDDTYIYTADTVDGVFQKFNKTTGALVATSLSGFGSSGSSNAYSFFWNSAGNMLIGGSDLYSTNFQKIPI